MFAVIVRTPAKRFRQKFIRRSASYQGVTGEPTLCVGRTPQMHKEKAGASAPAESSRGRPSRRQPAKRPVGAAGNEPPMKSEPQARTQSGVMNKTHPKPRRGDRKTMTQPAVEIESQWTAHRREINDQSIFVTLIGTVEVRAIPPFAR